MTTTVDPAAATPTPTVAPSPAAPAGSCASPGKRLAALMAGLVVIFAFVVACFPADNSDFLLHLATGRAVLSHGLPTGKDPFTETATSGAWAPDWLADVGFYLIYQIRGVGPKVLTICKALLSVALACLLIAGGRPERTLAVPAACAALALLALSPRLSMQPVVVSYLFLGLTLFLLRRELEPAQGAGPSSRSPWLLPPLFVLWANADEHFLLGPAAVALALVGQALQGLRQGRGKPHPSEVRRLGLVLAAGTIGCLINPAHIHALRIPWQLGLFPAAPGFGADQELRYLVVSPLERAFYQPGVGLNVAGMACLPLVLLGLASFALLTIRGRMRWWRLFVWIGFLLLALASHRSIAFFAVVAGPLLSLNTLDLTEGRQLVPRRRPLALQLLGVAACVVLILLGIPGWLQAHPARRQFGFGVRTDPSLEQAALRLRAWVDQGKLDPEERVFPTTPDMGCYLAWFCPQVKGFLDLRLHLFGEASRDFVAARKDLMGLTDVEGGQPAWRKVFRKWQVRYLVLHFRSVRRAGADVASSRLLLSTFGSNRGEWALCHLDGQTAIAIWNPRESQGSHRRPEALNLNTLAFGPDCRPVESASPSVAVSRWWLDPMPTPTRPLAADEASCFFTAYRVLQPSCAREQWLAFQSALVAGSIGAAAAGRPPGSAGQPLLQLLMAGTYRPGQQRKGKEPVLARAWRQAVNNYRNIRDAGPVAALYLGVRAARRSLAEQPQDADTCFLLAQMYLELARHTRESSLTAAPPHLRLLRQAQATATLEEVVRIDPNHAGALALLAELAQTRLLLGGRRADRDGLQSVHDVEGERNHLEELSRRIGRRGPARGESLPDFEQRLAGVKKESAALTNRVQKALDQFHLTAAGKPPWVRAEMALEYGLVATALNELRAAHEERDKAQAPRVAARLAEVLFATGRLQDAVEFLQGDNLELIRGVATPLGLPAADWFRLLGASVLGRYEQADAVLQRVDEQVQRQPNASSLLAQAVGHVLLWEAPLATGLPCQYLRRTPALLPGMPRTSGQFLSLLFNESMAHLSAEADRAALRGWLALEAGNIPQAREQLERGLSRSRTGAGQVMPFRAVPLIQLGLERLASAGSGSR